MFYEDGRVTQIQFDYPAAPGGEGNTVLLNIYFPNGGTRADGTEMLSYKLAFYDHLIAYIQQLQADGKHVIVVGDYNICHTEIDIARPEANQNSIGFLPIEREKVSEYLDQAQMIDVFRHFHPEMVDEYTWRSYRGGARDRNV
jgi:exodeoxyribonuclease-3